MGDPPLEQVKWPELDRRDRRYRPIEPVKPPLMHRALLRIAELALAYVLGLVLFGVGALVLLLVFMFPGLPHAVFVIILLCVGFYCIARLFSSIFSDFGW